MKRCENLQRPSPSPRLGVGWEVTLVRPCRVFVVPSFRFSHANVHTVPYCMGMMRGVMNFVTGPD